MRRFSQNYGRLLKQLRLEKGIGQREFARRLGVTHATISCLEAGKHAPSWELACRIAEELGVSLQRFVSCAKVPLTA